MGPVSWPAPVAGATPLAVCCAAELVPLPASSTEPPEHQRRGGGDEKLGLGSSERRDCEPNVAVMYERHIF